MKRLSGFSLMEMMIVLAIVAIVAAASAPMLNKKMVASTENKSPWEPVGNTASIVYNYSGAGINNNTASIGKISDDSKNPRLYIDSNGTNPHISFGTDSSTFRMWFGSDNSIALTNTESVSHGDSSIAIGSQSDSSLSAQGANSIAIGTAAKATGAGCVALGRDSVSKNNSIAIGPGAQATQFSSIAIGTLDATSQPATEATAIRAVALGQGAISEGKDSTALGAFSKVHSDNSIAIGGTVNSACANSVAIGCGAVTHNAHEIVLGTVDDTVYIPGNLVVGRAVALNRESKSSSTYETVVWYRNRGHRVMMSDASDYARANQAISDNGSTTNVVKLYNAYSDRRLKNVGKAFESGLAQIKKLEVFNYTFKDDKDKTPHVGVIAQDLKKIFPDAVIKGEDGFLRIRMEDMFYSLVNAVKELDSRMTVIEKQQKRIDELEKRLNELEKKLNN